MYRSSALGLQKSVAVRGLQDTLKDQEFPWRELAEAHMRSWLLTGVKGDRNHLELSADAWGHATKQLANATDPDCLVMYASVQQFIGNYSSSARILGEIAGSFENYDRISQVHLQAAIVHKSLHNYKESASYLEKTMSAGPPAPYSVIDLLFLKGRIYEEWSKEEDGREQVSHKSYMKVFSKLKNSGSIPADSDFDDWMNDPVTWCSVAEKTVAAGHYILSADLFHECITKHEEMDGSPPLPALWFEIAKSYCRCGRMKTAKQCLERALKIRSTDEAMVAVWKEWEEPSNRFNNQLNLPPAKFAKLMLEVTPVK